jgi:hypothetical protein
MNSIYYPKSKYDLSSLKNMNVISELEKILDLLVKVIPKNDLISIYLIGSTARNEISLINNELGIDILGDYEFVIVTNGILSPWKSKLQIELSKLGESFGLRSPLFDIDYGLVPLQKLKLIPPSLWSFEFVERGLLLFGREVRSNVPSVNVTNIDLGNLRWIIVVRLWSYLKNLRLVYRELSNDDEISRHKRLLVARNLLDIPTILLPHFDILISGYSSRNKYLEALPHDMLAKIGGISIFNEALHVKLNPEYEPSVIDLHQGILIESYMELLRIISPKLSWDGDPSSLTRYIKLCKRHNIFKLSFLKEVRMQHNTLIYFFKLLRAIGFFKALYWLFSSTRYNFFGFLIAFYTADNKKDKEEASVFLSIAIAYLSSASGEIIEIDSNSFSERQNAISDVAYAFMKSWYERNRG